MELLCTDLWTMYLYAYASVMFVLEITVKQVGGQEKSMYNVCARACEIILGQSEGRCTFSAAVCWCVHPCKTGDGFRILWCIYSMRELFSYRNSRC